MSQRFSLAFTGLLILVGLLVSGCTPDNRASLTDDATDAGLRGRVAVTNYPLYCFVKQICAANADGNSNAGPVKQVVYIGPKAGDDPHSWTPTSDQVRDLQNVDLIVCNGPGAVFANWMSRVTLEESKICNTTDAVKLEEFVKATDYQLVHSHGPEGEHSHAWVVAHSWLSPSVARKQANFCVKKLTELYGESETFDNGHAGLVKRFDELESKLESVKASAEKVVLTASTPEILYLTKALGLPDRYLAWSESRGAEQAEQEIRELRRRSGLEDGRKKVLLWTTPPIPELKEVVKTQWDDVAEISRIDCYSDRDYFEEMLDNLDRLEKAIL
jgi:zinc transport system substrate-binding protein